MNAHGTRSARRKAHSVEIAVQVADDEADLTGLAGLCGEDLADDDGQDSPIKGLVVRELEFSAFTQ